MFCAPTRMFDDRISLETSLSAVNGGHTTMSTSLMFRSDFSRVSAEIVLAHVLRADADVRRQNFLGNLAERGERRAHHDVHFLDVQIGFLPCKRRNCARSCSARRRGCSTTEFPWKPR